MLPSCLISSCCLSSAHPGLSPPLWPSTEGPLPGTEGASKSQLEPRLSRPMGTPDTRIVFLSFFFLIQSVFEVVSGIPDIDHCLKMTAHVLYVISVKQGETAPGKSELLSEVISGSSWRLHQSVRWALSTSPVLLLQAGWVEQVNRDCWFAMWSNCPGQSHFTLYFHYWFFEFQWKTLMKHNQK